MKEVYGDYIYDQLSQEVTLYHLFVEATDVEIHEGRVFVEGVHRARNRAGGPRPESGVPLPSPQTQTYDRFEIPIRRYHGAGSFTAQSLLSAASNRGAFVRTMDSEVNGAMNDLKLEMEVDLGGQPNGILSVVNSVGAVANGNTTINLYPANATDEFGAGAAGHQNHNSIHGSRYLSEGLELHIASINAATGVATYRNPLAGDQASNAFAVYADPTTFNTVVLTGDQDAQGIVQGDVLMRYRGHGQTSGTDVAVNNLYGLEYLIDDTSFVPDYLDNIQGLDRSSLLTLRSTVVDQNGAEIADDNDIINAVYRIEESSGLYPSMIVTTRPGQRIVYNLYRDDARYLPQTFPTGFKGNMLTINVGNKDLPIYVGKHLPYRTMYFINWDKMKRYIQADFHLSEESGSVLERNTVTGGVDDSWVFRIRWHGNIGTVQPNAHGKITDIDGDQMDQRMGASSPAAF